MSATTRTIAQPVEKIWVLDDGITVRNAYSLQAAATMVHTEAKHWNNSMTRSVAQRPASLRHFGYEGVRDLTSIFPVDTEGRIPSDQLDTQGWEAWTRGNRSQWDAIKKDLAQQRREDRRRIKILLREIQEKAPLIGTQDESSDEA